MKIVYDARKDNPSYPDHMYQNGYLIVYKNPLAKDIKKMLLTAKSDDRGYGSPKLRASTDNKNMYVWDATYAIHHDIYRLSRDCWFDELKRNIDIAITDTKIIMYCSYDPESGQDFSDYVKNFLDENPIIRKVFPGFHLELITVGNRWEVTGKYDAGII